MQQEPADDYGYDLVHEVPITPEITPPEAGPHPEEPYSTGQTADQDGDYGYDLAHDVPR